MHAKTQRSKAGRRGEEKTTCAHLPGTLPSHHAADQHSLLGRHHVHPLRLVAGQSQLGGPLWNHQLVARPLLRQESRLPQATSLRRNLQQHELAWKTLPLW